MRYLLRPALLAVLFMGGYASFSQTPLKPRDPSIIGPQTFAMVVGVSKYKYVRPLAYADKDAQLFSDYLRSPGGGSVKEENIFLLLNEKASNSSFWGKGFQWLKAKNLGKGDRLFIYLAGHGDAIDEDQFFFLGYDCNPEGDKNNYLVSGAIQLFNLKKKIANETTKGVEVFFIMDACRSNELPGGATGQNFLNSAVSEKKAGEIIMLATGAGQESLEDASIGNGQGLFTYYLVDGLSGVADSIGGADKKVTFREIQTYVDRNVPFVAEQRFKRKQDPFFCCNENSDKVISTVDTAYLRKWLNTKKLQSRGGGNAFTGNEKKVIRLNIADTLLIETYNRFYSAINNKNLTGIASAEDYFHQLDKKFPGNPYTLDAKSSLAVEYINFAQSKVDRYLACGEDGSDKQKQENAEAASRLEKAIASVREDDADFANSLLGRMYLLRAGANNVSPAVAFQNAYAALAIDRNGAYIHNKLALLHWQNNRMDSALYYAGKAVNIAPNWACALTTLALIQRETGPIKPVEEKKKPKTALPKSSIGFTFGGGINRYNPDFVVNPNTDVVAVDTRSSGMLNLGILYNFNLSQVLAIRPVGTLIFGNTDLYYQRRNPVGGGVTTYRIPVNNTSLNGSLPVIFRFSGKKANPYFFVSPSFNYTLGEKSRDLPTKKSQVLADAGIGADIRISRTGMVISPELKYTAGLTDVRDNGSSTIYSSTIASLKKQGFTLNVSIRKR